jgi:phosphoserine phosphatase RsbU/P
MRSPSDPADNVEVLREQLIGLGESSHRKSYYPELQKRLEELERFKTFLDHSNDAIFLIDVPSARIVDLNASACSQLGWGREEFLERSIFDVSGLADNDRATQLLGAAHPGARERALVETMLRRRDGSLIPSEITLNRLYFRQSTYVIAVARDITRRRLAEEALRESEKDRYKLQAELELAAEVQNKLLPGKSPWVEGFEISARCLPARQVGGDFFDWQVVAPGCLTLTLGDVMGKGIAAAMVMATVRAALRAVSRTNPPALALALAEQALHQDLDNSGSFATLFHAQLDARSRTLTFVDCGHGFVFLRRTDGAVEELNPRGLPFGILPQDIYQEGTFTFAPGDALVLYSDGLIDALPELELNHLALAQRLGNASTAAAMVEALVSLVPREVVRPDDLTVLVVRCTGEAGKS